MKGIGAIAFAGVIAISAPSFAATDDATFVQTAIGINLEEIELGNLAQQQSQNADVKAYGQTLVKDHTDNLAKATALAQSIGASIPGAPSTEAQDMAKHLAKLSGTAFDKEFLDHRVKGHQTAIQLFTDQVGGTNDVAAYAKATLPSLQQHESQARLFFPHSRNRLCHYTGVRSVQVPPPSPRAYVGLPIRRHSASVA